MVRDFWNTHLAPVMSLCGCIKVIHGIYTEATIKQERMVVRGFQGISRAAKGISSLDGPWLCQRHVPEHKVKRSIY